MTRFWRAGKTTWHLMREAPGSKDMRAYCGRLPQGAWKASIDDLYPWPDRSCFSCMDVLVGNTTEVLRGNQE